MERDDAKGLLLQCSAIQSMANESGLGTSADDVGPLALFDKVVTHEEIRKASRRLFMDGYYALAVEECYKCVNNMVKSRSGLPSDGTPLMQAAFSPQNPALKLNSMKTESERNEQQGYKDIFAGCMMGIRNPRAHGHGLVDDPVEALEMIGWGNHLMTKLDRAEKS